MCLILFGWQQHPRYRLVVVANRDEFYERPTASAGFWPHAPKILAGRDLGQGGTWLGVTTTGRFAALTNYRDGNVRDPAKLSRGWLVQEFLLGSKSPIEHLREVEARAEAYNGFGLVVGDGERLCFFSNRTSGMRDLAPGLYGLSNHMLDTPWPKVVRGKSILTQMLQSGDPLDADAALDLLADTTIAEDDLLPDTGVGMQRERMLSPIFVRGDVYGTRSSTVLTIDRKGEITLVERSFDKTGRITGTTTHRFAMENISVQLRADK